MKITNKGQLNSLFISKGCSIVPKELDQKVYKNNLNNPIVRMEIEDECRKPLQSKFAVEAKGKTRWEWYSHNTERKRYFQRHFGNTYYEVDADEFHYHDVGSAEILKEQQALYNKLKREYQKALKGEDITDVEKVEAITRKKSIQLLNGLVGQPRYDRIYGGC